MQSASQSFTKCLLKRIAFVVEWWKTLNKGANAAQQRVANSATLNEALQTEVSLHQQTEVALRTSERRFRCTFEQAAVGMVIANLDSQWLQVNQRFCNLVGYSESELLAAIVIRFIIHRLIRPGSSMA